MLKSMEIINFENHEHTILEHFSEKFNLIVGPSNAGKTSIARALMLVAYNQYDPRSLRLGKKYCEVKVTTDKGYVKVKRGKDINSWEVYDAKNNKKSNFSNIGIKIIPEVENIIGLKIVKLGSDVEVKANIASQLDAHFLMAEVEGENASGSLRALVLDEISGLTGIENIITEVATDNMRLGKAIKEKEENIKDLGTKLHDEEKLNKEEKLIKDVEERIKHINECNETIDDLKKIEEEVNKIAVLIKEKKTELAKYPDEKQINAAMAFYKTCIENNEALKFLRDASNKHVKALGDIRKTQANLDSLIGTDEAEAAYKDCNENLETRNDLVKMNNDFVTLQETINEQTNELAKLPRTKKLETELQKIDNNLENLAEINSINIEYNTKQATVVRINNQIIQFNKQFEEMQKKEKEILKDLNICPLCKQTITVKE